MRARQLTEQAEKCGLALRYVPLELSDPAGIDALAAGLVGDSLDVVVHNAGFAIFGAISSAPGSRTLETISHNRCAG